NATLLGLTGDQLRTRFEDIIGFAELEQHVDKKLKNYSSGMLVRLAFSIAIQVDFDVLLLDEVLAVGDQSFQEKCYATFDRFRDPGQTSVSVSDALGSVMRFCDRALLIRNGAAEAIGPPHDVVAEYAPLFTANAASIV